MTAPTAKFSVLASSILLAAAVVLTAAEVPPPVPPKPGLKAKARLPVTEITVFKDGHAFVVHEGEMAVDARGNVNIDRLPAPVLGTFWASSLDPQASLRSVTAGVREATIERPALTIRELLEANVGAQAVFTENGGARYAGTIIDVPEAPPAEMDGPGPAGSPNAAAEKKARKGSVILIRTDGGTKALGIDRIQDVTFLGPPQGGVREEETRNSLRLDLDWAGGKPGTSVRVGMAYIQKGLRWIPDYRVDLDGKGGVALKLQAILINELEDIEDTTVHLVIGVPNIYFKDTLDPISLRKALAPLSSYFQDASQTSNLLSNAIMTQTTRMGEYRPQAPEEPAADLGPEIAGGGHEDLFIFTLKGVTLKKGERMVLPVAEAALKYRDVYILDLPFSPPPELQRNSNTEQDREMARLFRSPKVVHKVRLENTARFPLTTAPALILRDGRILAQSLLTYTSQGGTSDLEITKAINIRVGRSDTETGRTPRAERWRGTDFARIDLAGKVSLTSFLGNAAEVEVTRHVLGRADSADHEGTVQAVNAFEDGRIDIDGLPSWWNWYSWPAGWHQLNGIGRISWNLRLEPGKTVDLGYAWHYFAP